MSPATTRKLGGPDSRRCSTRRRMDSRLSAPTWSHGAPSKRRSSRTTGGASARRRRLDVRAGDRRTREDEAVDTPREQRPDRPRLAIRVLGGVGEHQGQPLRSGRVLDAVHHLGEGGLAGVGDDQTDAVGARSAHGAGDCVLAVAGLLDRAGDLSRVAGSTLRVPFRTCERSMSTLRARRATSTIVVIALQFNVSHGGPEPTEAPFRANIPGFATSLRTPISDAYDTP